MQRPTSASITARMARKGDATEAHRRPPCSDVDASSMIELAARVAARPLARWGHRVHGTRHPTDELGCLRTVPDMTTTFDDGQPSLTDLAAAVDAERDALGRLGAIRRLRTALTAIESETVRAARADGASWAAVGAELGISKQAANKRLGATPEEGSQKSTVSRGRAQSPRTGWEIAIPGRRALLHIRPRRDGAR